VKEKRLIRQEDYGKPGFLRRLGRIFLDEERRAFVVLSIFMVVLTLVAGTFTIVQDHILEHKFCQLIDASIQTPAKKPVNPKTAPAQEKLYQDYIIVSNLDRSLGCAGATHTGG
jgi:hypothetical protein